MGRRGPAPTPRSILQMRGSRRAESGAPEVEFTRGRPPCPTFLAGEAKSEWNRQVKELDAAGLLQKVDRAMLAAWCEAWGEFVTLCEAIERAVNPPSPGESGEPQAAAPPPPRSYSSLIMDGTINAKNKAVERLVRLGAQFGFSPSARRGVTAPVASEQDETHSGVEPRRRA